MNETKLRDSKLAKPTFVDRTIQNSRQSPFSERVVSLALHDSTEPEPGYLALSRLGFHNFYQAAS